jgi:hypothetical protein
MTIGQHHIIHHIAGAMEEYGESAVFDVVARVGDYTEIVASLNIEAGKKLQRIARYHTHDGMTFLTISSCGPEKIHTEKEGGE